MCLGPTERGGVCVCVCGGDGGGCGGLVWGGGGWGTQQEFGRGGILGGTGLLGGPTQKLGRGGGGGCDILWSMLIPEAQKTNRSHPELGASGALERGNAQLAVGVRVSHETYLLKTQLLNFLGNMGYMSVKD